MNANGNELLDNLQFQVRECQNKLARVNDICADSMRRLLNVLGPLSDGCFRHGERTALDEAYRAARCAIGMREQAEIRLSNARRELDKAVDLSARMFAKKYGVMAGVKS